MIKKKKTTKVEPRIITANDLTWADPTNPLEVLMEMLTLDAIDSELENIDEEE